MSWLALILGAYLLGSISFSLLIVRATAGSDIREQGSGNAGATNVLRIAGKGAAGAVLMLDIVKGALPVQVAQALSAPGPVVGWVAVAAVVGHIFPVFHSFRGGKGVATVTGALGSLAIIPAGLTALMFFTVLAVTRYVALASMTAVAAFPMLLLMTARAGWIPPPPTWLLVSSVTIGLLIIGKHQANLRRLLAGTEPRLGDPKSREKTV